MVAAANDSGDWRRAARTKIESSIHTSNHSTDTISARSLEDDIELDDSVTDVKIVDEEPSGKTVDTDTEKVDAQREVEKKSEPKKEENTVPFRGWDYEDLEDVELGDPRYPVNYDAFEKIKREREEANMNKKSFCFSALVYFVAIGLFLLIVGLIIAIAGVNKDIKEIKDVVPPVVVSAAEMFLSPSFFSFDVNHTDNGSSSYLQQNPVSLIGFQPLPPLEANPIARGSKHIIFVNNLEVPEGGHLQYQIYDGLNCRAFNGGANDITRSISSGFLGQSPQHGFYLSWEYDEKTTESSIYKSRPSLTALYGNDDVKYGTMDLCVGVSLLDGDDVEVDYRETFVLTAWAGNRLENAYTIAAPKN